MIKSSATSFILNYIQRGRTIRRRKEKNKKKIADKEVTKDQGNPNQEVGKELLFVQPKNKGKGRREQNTIVWNRIGVKENIAFEIIQKENQDKKNQPETKKSLKTNVDGEKRGDSKMESKDSLPLNIEEQVGKGDGGNVSVNTIKSTGKKGGKGDGGDASVSTMKSIEISTHLLPKSMQKQNNLDKDQASSNKGKADVRGATKEMFGENSKRDTAINKVREKSKEEAGQGRESQQLSDEEVETVRRDIVEEGMEQNIQEASKAGDLSPRHSNNLGKNMKKVQHIPLQVQTRSSRGKSNSSQ